MELEADRIEAGPGAPQAVEAARDEAAEVSLRDAVGVAGSAGAGGAGEDGSEPPALRPGRLAAAPGSRPACATPLRRADDDAPSSRPGSLAHALELACDRIARAPATPPGAIATRDVAIALPVCGGDEGCDQSNGFAVTIE